MASTLAVLAGLSGTPGCAKRSAAAGPTPPDLAEVTSQARCSVRRSADKPLVVEWPAADRAALEARAQRSLVAVRYEGCTMEVLDGCDVDGSYAFVPLSLKQERVTIRSEDELYARLPVGAAALEATLARQGQLDVDMTIVGRKQADRHVLSRSELHGRCEGATHVLTGLTVGAFSLYAGAGLEAGARAQLGAAGAGAAYERSREILASDGDPAGCAGQAAPSIAVGNELAAVPPPLPGTEGVAEPPATCGALLRVEAVPLADDPSTSVSAPASASIALEGAPTVQPLAHPDATARLRRFDRAAAWRGTAIASGVLSGASLGGMLGGIVLLFQSNDQPVWEDISAENARKKRIGTGMLVGSSIGFVAFGALALGAASAQRAQPRRYAWFAPAIERRTVGLGLGMRF